MVETSAPVTRKRKNRGLRTRGDRVFDTTNVIILFVLGLIMLFPFYVTFISSITPSTDFGRRNVILYPSRIDFTSFRTIIGASTGLVNAYKITVFSTVVGTACNMFVTVLAAVGLSNRNLPYRKYITLFFLVPVYFGGGLIPSYLLIKSLGLINSIWVFVVSGLVGIMNVLLMRNFIMGIPAEITESAFLDGCSEMRLIWYILLPLSVPAIATFSLFYAVGHWNNLSTSVIYINDSSKYNLQAYLMTILQDARQMQNNPEELAKLYEEGLQPPPNEALRSANIMAATIPIICVYPFLQKYFVKGLVVGSLKG